MHTCVVDRTTAETGCVGIVDIDKLLKYLKNISIFSKSISMKSQLGAGPSAGPRRSGVEANKLQTQYETVTRL